MKFIGWGQADVQFRICQKFYNVQLQEHGEVLQSREMCWARHLGWIAKGCTARAGVPKRLFPFKVVVAW